MKPALRNALLIFVVGWAFAPPALADRPYKGGVIATAHAVSSEAGQLMLRKGGNAVDAAVAAAFAQAVVAPYHSGLGGGGFAVVWDAKAGKGSSLDFREVAPKAATATMFQRDGEAVPELSQDGILAVAVPGAVAGYLELLAKHGTLSPKVVLQPAIQAARDGFWVSPKFVALATERRACLEKDAEAARLFLRPGADGALAAPEIGTLIKQPELAQTLTAIAAQGAKGFYAGKVAKGIEATMKEKGGLVTLEDLAAYKVRPRAPLESSYRGHRLLTMPPPSAGGLTLVQTLGVLELAQPQKFSLADPESLHLYVETLRRAYVDRAKYMGDPDFVQIPLERLVSKPYLAELLASIDRNKATPSSSLLGPGGAAPAGASAKPPGTPTVQKNTTHISVIDKAGNAIALTTTVNYSFGSCVVAKGTGVVLNDEMDDFAAKPFTANVYGLVTGDANAVAPGKVPLSSMTPTLVFQKEDPKKVMIAAGSPGGSTIPTTVIQVLSHMIDRGMDPVRAVGEGRVHHQYLPDHVQVDRFGPEPATEKALVAKGHQIFRKEQWGDAEVVFADPKTGLRYGGSDPRNEGAVLGTD